MFGTCSEPGLGSNKCPHSLVRKGSLQSWHSFKLATKQSCCHLLFSGTSLGPALPLPAGGLALNTREGSRVDLGGRGHRHRCLPAHSLYAFCWGFVEQYGLLRKEVELGRRDHRHLGFVLSNLSTFLLKICILYLVEGRKKDIGRGDRQGQKQDDHGDFACVSTLPAWLALDDPGETCAGVELRPGARATSHKRVTGQLGWETSALLLWFLCISPKYPELFRYL